MGKEMESEYYDNYFDEGNEFDVHYKESHYWVHWTQVIRFLGNDRSKKILEVGCGTGQLAEFLKDEGFLAYQGFDFSQKGVEIAQKRVTDFDFFVGDATQEESYKTEYDIVICLEVLEHIEDDIKVLENIDKNKMIIFSVPDFPAPSHVRRFLSERAVKKRYFKYIDIRKIIKIGSIYVVQGFRSDFKPGLTQRLLCTREEVGYQSFKNRIYQRWRDFIYRLGFG